ncbi:hypothetical protein [Clostridium sp. ZS2-4]|uniref:hypothetical protein n=1 Tax=Clostridium sp. ZS2-4 TaxID=2987703 RepID=UPI00227B8406|nr:hypothetical protein [Clostridium sp. ZS2-4]MCY6356004.1 hypothetical protein [Clostridium sp. ZS2-4]
MSSDWINSVNQSGGSEKIRDINEYIEKIDSGSLYKSAIDRFYKSVRGILSISRDPSYLDVNTVMGPLLFIGIISCTENYLREILSEAIKICPICKAKSASQSISLGSVLWHSGSNVERGSFENISFADADAIKKTCKKFLGYDIDKTGLAYAALEEFDKICELRHGVVHSNTIIAGKNAIKLGIKSDNEIIKVKIAYKQLQECAAICTSLVSSLNTELFILMVKRWAIKWPKLPLWNSKDDNKNFNLIWNMFYSKIDSNNGLIPKNISMIKCRNQVKREFNR